MLRRSGAGDPANQTLSLCTPASSCWGTVGSGTGLEALLKTLPRRMALWRPPIPSLQGDLSQPPAQGPEEGEQGLRLCASPGPSTLQPPFAQFCLVLSWLRSWGGDANSISPFYPKDRLG